MDFQSRNLRELEDASQGGLGPHQGGLSVILKKSTRACPQPEKEPALGHLPHREHWCLPSLHLASVSSLAGSIAASTESERRGLLCADREWRKMNTVNLVGNLD